MTPVSNKNSNHQPTGNLEDLFRQKFAEAELTPRADVWDRLDHELLVRENQGYRQRIGGYRRLAAAACAVASLGIGAWLTQQPVVSPDSVGASGAVVATRSGSSSAAGTAASPADASLNTGSSASGSGSLGMAGRTRQAPEASSAAEPRLLAAATVSEASADAEVASPGASTRIGSSATAVNAGSAGTTGSAGRVLSASGGLSVAALTARPERVGVAGLRQGFRSERLAALAGAESVSLREETTESFLLPEELHPVAAHLRRASGALRPDSLKASLLSVPAMLAAEITAADEERESAASNARRWRWRGGYGAQHFVPNVNQGGGIVTASRMALTSAPSGTYSADLRPGVAHRGHLGGTIGLGSPHWTLLTGAELTVASGTALPENSANYDYYAPNVTNYNRPTPRQGSYHLTTAGVPVQVRYQGSKTGWSMYAAVGAAVNVLLGSRTEMGQETYVSTGSYRRVLASARGGAGVRYSPAGASWHFALGPEAEAGLNTLNANPTGRWGERTRPYGVGLAASVEFGAQ